MELFPDEGPLEISMPQVLGIDHIAFVARDLEATCAFYDQLFGARVHLDYAPEGKSLVRQIALGGALLSIHQAGNGLDLVAKHPTVGGADICLRWSGSVDSAAELLHQHEIPIVDGPSPRRTADGLASRSVYFRDPDGNLLELMAAESLQPKAMTRGTAAPSDASDIMYDDV
jgi:catechol 2,3-dioxygenase-like lactoylglutathione lyase family enzyme